MLKGTQVLGWSSKWLAGAALVALSGLIAPSVVSADSFSLFDVTGTFSNGDSFDAGSTITIDTTTGLVTTASMEISGPGTSTTYDETFSGAPLAPPSQYSATWDGSLNDILTLVSLPPNYWTDFTGGTNVGIDGGLSVNGFLAAGIVTLSNPVATPEPSSLSLLITGLLGLAGMGLFRKRAVD